MPFRKPVSTMGGLNFWINVQQNEHFVMRKHKTGLWPYKFRILMRATSKEIANANDLETIQYDWRFLETNAVPRIDESGFLEITKVETIVEDLIMKTISNKMPF